MSHPNVCRVYDVGEVAGRSFLTMEYIDGEDLASLLKRVGRLSPPKALEVARGGPGLLYLRPSGYDFAFFLPFSRHNWRQPAATRAAVRQVDKFLTPLE